jgi:hypothetical protein
MVSAFLTVPGRIKQAASYPKDLPAFIRVGELGRNLNSAIRL